MIIVQLVGGLGNQMFQYAAGRYLAYSLNTELKLDISQFRQDALREYHLSVFNITENIASATDLDQVRRPLAWNIKHPLEWLRSMIRRNVQIRYVKEKHFHFDQEILALPDNVYLEGYWQSEKYFAKISDIIKKEFSFVNPPSRINQEILDEIRGCNSVSLHIRRGDYVSNQKTMEILGVLGIEYYIRALNFMEKNVIKPHIFVFSDDIQWARKNLKTNLPLHFVDHNRMKMNYEDLRLMSNCQYYIIANSSFSWWGAWLGSNSEKIVITPKNWFNQPKMDARDLIPDSWIKK
jgi:hypothetical protein